MTLFFCRILTKGVLYGRVCEVKRQVYIVKRITRAEIARNIANRFVGATEMKRRREEYEEQRDSFKSSPEGQFEQKVRNVTQNATNAEMAAYQKFVDATISLKEEIIELIKEYLQEHSNGQEIKDLKGQDIKECLRRCSVALNKLQILCDGDIYKENKTHGIYSEYEKMFNHLIDKVNIRFAFFAPELSLRRKSIKYSKMTTSERFVMYERLQELGITEMEGFEEAYGEVFEIITRKGNENRI